MDWQDRIISLYLKISELSQQTLRHFCQRFSNNSQPLFTDEEVITIYMSGIEQGYKTIKQIHEHASSYWKALFPKLPGYAAFNHRLNRLEDVFTVLVELYQSAFPSDYFKETHYRVIDSMPIVMAQQGRRFHAKVAPEIASSGGYCATKKLYYYGVKLHIMGSYQKGQLPVPEYIGITAADMADIKAYEQLLADDCITDYEKFADKAYIGKQTENTQTYTPVKKEKGQEHLDASDQLYSAAISRIRQPIESFNNWIEEKTGIQKASKVRSKKGLMVHIFGRLSVGFKLLYQRMCQS